VTTESDAGIAQPADEVAAENEDDEEEDDEDVSKYKLDSEEEVWSAIMLMYRCD